MRYIPGVYQGVPNQREFRAAATGRPLQWDRSDQPAALAAYLNVAFRSMLTPAGWGVLEPARRAGGERGRPRPWCQKLDGPFRAYRRFSSASYWLSDGAVPNDVVLSTIDW